MAAFCCLALCVGAALAVWMPMLHLAVGLVAATLAGACLAVGSGIPVGSVVLWSIALFVCAQVGYALGLAILAAIRHRRRKAETEHRLKHGAPDVLKQFRR